MERNETCNLYLCRNALGGQLSVEVLFRSTALCMKGLVTVLKRVLQLNVFFLSVCSE